MQKQHPQRQVALLLGYATLLLFVCLLLSEAFSAFLAHTDPAIHRHDQWCVLAALFLLQIPVLGYSLWLWRSMATAVPRPFLKYRPGLKELIWRRLFLELPTFLVLGASYGYIWEWRDIGGNSPYELFVGGVAAWAILKLQGLRRGADRPIDDIHREWKFAAARIKYHLPRGSRFTRVLHGLLVVLVASPLEEIIYRGFFVFLLGNLLSHAWMGILAGLVLCLVVHLYQGTRAAHTMYFVTWIVLLYSSGLLAAIVCHAACNFVIAARLTEGVEHYIAYLNWRRHERRRQAAVPA